MTKRKSEKAREKMIFSEVKDNGKMFVLRGRRRLPKTCPKQTLSPHTYRMELGFFFLKF